MIQEQDGNGLCSVRSENEIWRGLRAISGEEKGPRSTPGTIVCPNRQVCLSRRLSQFHSVDLCHDNENILVSIKRVLSKVCKTLEMVDEESQSLLERIFDASPIRHSFVVLPFSSSLQKAPFQRSLQIPKQLSPIL